MSEEKTTVKKSIVFSAEDNRYLQLAKIYYNKSVNAVLAMFIEENRKKVPLPESMK
jgi:hypothetical protein